MNTRSNSGARIKCYSALPMTYRFESKPDQNELTAIKLNAKKIWSQKDKEETTYAHYFKEPEVKEKTPLRPSSPTRRNNPHPSLIFLTTKMNYIHGHYNSQAKSPMHYPFDSKSSSLAKPTPRSESAIEHRKPPNLSQYSATRFNNDQIKRDYKIYREKYENGDHGMPNLFLRRPFRGDYSIHYQWHPQLKHHSLSCLC